MSRKGWLLFGVMCVVWGIPYLLIKVAVSDVGVPIIVAGRCALGALLLLPFALASGQFGALRKHWLPLLAFAAGEMIIPWGLLSQAERKLPSSLAGLLIAAVPIIGVIVARLTGGNERLGARRWTGLIIGLGGVAVLAGKDLTGGGWLPIVEVLLVAVGYACGPLVAARKLGDVPALPMTVACLTLTSVCYAPWALVTLPHHVPGWRVLGALAGLGVVCTAFAFMIFLALIKEAGASRAMVITYVNPAVAVVAGVALLGEPFTPVIATSFGLILFGCLLATGRQRAPAPEPSVPEAATT